MKKLAFALFATVSPFVISTTAFAEDTPSTELPAVTVTATKDSLVSPGVEEAKENIQKIPGSVAVVDAEDYKDGHAVSIRDALGYVPGVIVQTRHSIENRLSIRGSGLSRLFGVRGIYLYQDGVPINLADGLADFQDIDPLAFNHVDIYKGANGLQFGAATLGGAVNFVSPTGYTASPLEAVVEGGSFGTALGHVSSGQVSGNFDYYTSLTGYHSDGYRDQNTQNDAKFYSNFGYRINDTVENRTYFTFVNANLGIPGQLTRSQVRTSPRMANAFNTALKQERNYNEYRVANKTTWDYDDFKVNAGLYTTYKDLDHPIFQVLDNQTFMFGAFADSTFEGSIAGLGNELLLGVNLNQGTTDAKRYANVAGSRGAQTADGDENSKTAIFYVQDSLQATDQLKLIAGSQFLYSERDYDDRFLSNGDQSGTRDYYGTSPKIGAIYDYTQNVQFYTNISAAYEPPTFGEVLQTSGAGLANISAQKSYSFEVGTRGIINNANFDLAVYRAHLRDELLPYAVSPGVVQTVNADKTIHQGIELGFDTKILHNLSGNRSGDSVTWKIAYTYSDFYFDGDATYGNNDIPGTPEHFIRSELRYDNPAGFYIAPNVEIAPQGYAIDSANTIKSDSYYLVGANAGYDINDHTTIYVDARNLLDRNYVSVTDILSTATGDPEVYYPGESRSVYVGLKYKW